ncbi:hypothetical protein A5708_01015 [Mycobacterium colombiense]|uniref:Uncharacterized protein n=1 Tax=Mycobacterium colombiense TaxID=339268 RepID=A0A1A2YIP3_9MYCO|nr:hypothetical protein A5708_01015 [Mycobacterium colombiense]
MDLVAEAVMARRLQAAAVRALERAAVVRVGVRRDTGRALATADRVRGAAARGRLRADLAQVLATEARYRVAPRRQVRLPLPRSVEVFQVHLC